MTLRITITEEKDTVIMAPAGRIDSFSIDELQEGFEQVKETGKSNMILLLRDLEYINSRGIGALLSFFKWAKDAGGAVRLAEVSPHIMDLLNLVGLEGLAGVYPTLPEAVEHLNGEAATSEVYARAEEPEDLRFLGNAAAEKSRMPFILAGAGIVIAAILVYLFLKPAERAPGPESTLATKLEVLERRVAQLETRGRVPVQQEEKLETLSKSLAERMNKIEQDLARLKGAMEAAIKKAEAAPVPAPQKEQDRPKQASHHTVSKGETLYRIALQYNMTIEELSRLNNLRPNQPIFPGQKLLVKAQKGE